MSLDKLKRVMWRLKEKNKNKAIPITFKQVKLAICQEMGTDDRTVYNAFQALIEMDMIDVYVTLKEQATD